MVGKGGALERRRVGCVVVGFAQGGWNASAKVEGVVYGDSIRVVVVVVVVGFATYVDLR